MARMRTLKPEFWSSPNTAQADLAVRLTFLALWNWADDSGHGTANLKELEAFVFPNDDVSTLPRRRGGVSGDRRGFSGDGSGGSPDVWRSFAEVCGEVAEAYGVVFYEVSGRRYYEIANFKKHQAKDYRETSKYPLPSDGQIVDLTCEDVGGAGSRGQSSGGASGDRRGFSAHPSGKTSLVTGEQGKRVKGESVPPVVVTLTSARDDAPERGDSLEPHDPGDDTHTPALRHDDGTPTAAGIVREWERASGVPQTSTSRTAMRLAVAQCLKTGHPPETIAAGLAAWATSKITAHSQIPAFVDRAALTGRITAPPAATPTNADGWLATGEP